MWCLADRSVHSSLGSQELDKPSILDCISQHKAAFKVLLPSQRGKKRVGRLNSGRIQYHIVWVSSPPSFSPCFPSQKQGYCKGRSLKELFSEIHHLFDHFRFKFLLLYKLQSSKPLHHLPTSVRHSPKEKGIFLASVGLKMRNTNTKKY